ncbi:hypothetical protein Taro_003953 [Colocasia esculenta]|uniref:Uncharacterized protein n=1 Tax=Colocasia esculenta TaxID=4460 RepID=A0A843TGX6_COLES|nr:hypothetical protein [Colocasia esculenta]
MGDEGLRTQQFVRGLRPELRQTLIVARVTDLDAAYQTATTLEADTLRTRARSAEVQTQVVPSQPRQQQGSVQTTPRTATSYASTSTGTMAKSGSRRKFRRDRRQAEQRHLLVAPAVVRQVAEAQQADPELHSVLLPPEVELCEDGTLLLSDLSSWEAHGSCGVARSGGKRVVLV